MNPAVNKLLDRVRQMRFLTISFLLHFVLITLLGGVVLFKAVQQPETFVASGGIVETPDDFMETTEEADSGPPEMEAPAEPTEVATSDPASAITSLTSVATVSISAPAPVAFQTAGTAFSPTMATSMNPRSSSGGGARKPGAMSARSGAERLVRLEQTGGKKEGEEAVMKGLRWLQRVQNPDGTWGENNAYKSAMTGFALLCFLGHGEVPGESVEFGATVKKGIDALLKAAAKNPQGRFGGNNVYAHGIATYAMAEAYAMLPDPQTATVLTKAIDEIIKAQGADGGWMYNFSKEVPSDTSVSGWFIQALKTAKLADIKHEGITPCLDKALLNINRVWDDNSKTYGYRKPGDRSKSNPGLNGVGVLAKLFIEGKADNMAKDGMETVLDLPRLDYKDKTANIYAWYYNTQAAFQMQGGAWRKWNGMFQNELIKNQSADGSWPPHGGKGHGPEAEATMDGNVYRTCLCILMLEVYYRYSPISKIAPK